MAASSSKEATVGPTAQGLFRTEAFQPSLGEFPDKVDRAVSRDLGPNLKIPLPDDWEFVLPTVPDGKASQLARHVSKEDANSFRNAFGPPGILKIQFHHFLASFYPFIVVL